jgi:carbonic anhydrase
MALHSEAELQERVGASAGVDASWHEFHVIEDQLAQLEADVHKVRTHPLVPDGVPVAGFLYDVDTGLIQQLI